MKIFTEKKQNKFFDPFIGSIFFIIIGLIFFKYDIDFSILLLTFLLFVYANFFRKIDNLPSHLDLCILGMIAIWVPLLTTATFKISGYGISAIGFAILITLLFENLELSFIFSLFISLLGASISDNNLGIGTSLFAGAITASILTIKVRRRFQVIKAGFIAGLIQFFFAYISEGRLTFFMISSLDLPFLRDLFTVCMLNGLISSFIVLGVLPVFEYIFKVVTNISLLELSDFNHPLLRRLLLEAPGTYQHSLVVANLSESAAEAAGANSLLARVGAYYHDVGKLVKPDYFTENLVRYKNMHEKLKPSMSKLIILNHVKEGIDLARKHNLNPKIIDFIVQHHGRTLVYYFYHRARELEPNGKHEEEYRYPGPNPQSKETAIVSLADTLEALSRTMEEPTPSRIEEMVREIVKRRFMEGELDESSLTMKDLEKITQSFVRMLNAIFHTRINYPKDESRNNKSPKSKENKS